MGLLDRLSALLGGDGADDGGASGGRTGERDAGELTAAEFREEAEAFAEDHGDDYRLDFTLESLAELDEYAAGQGEVMGALGDEMDDGELVEELHGGYTLWTGSYLGEVLVRELDGEWVEADGWAVRVPGDGEDLEVAVFDVAAESLAREPMFAAVGEEVRQGAAGGGGGADATSGEPGGGLGLAAAAGAAEEAATEQAAAARELSEFWSEYDLDFTPASLARLDDLVDDQWEKERFRDAELGGDAHVDDLTFTGLVEQLGSYYGEVLVRTLDAEWVDSEELGTAVEVPGRGEEAAVVNVYHVASDCLTEPSKFALSFDTVVDQLDLDHERVSEGGHVVAAERDGDDPADLDPEAVVEGFAADAEALVERHPDYDLDYSPESLERLDRLAAEEFEGHDFAGVELGREDDGDSLFLTAQAMEAGGYLAAVLERHLGGEWREDDGLTFVVEGRDAEAHLDPVAVAADVFRGEDSFAATYDALAGRLTIPGEDEEPEPTPGRPTSGEEGSAADDPAEPDGPSRDPTLERFAAKAAAETAAEEQADPDPAAAAARHEEAAAELVEAWPGYDLDHTVESLVRLDALVAAEFDRSGGDRDYEGDPLTVPEGAQLSIPTDGSVEAFGGYLAALFRRHHGAEWTVEDGDPVLAVEGPAGATALDPDVVTVACFAGESSFVDAYAHVAAEAGLEPPIEG